MKTLCLWTFENLLVEVPVQTGARFSKNRSSKLISIFDPILVPTWLHFGSIFRILGGLGGLLGRLGASWARLGGLLGRLGRVLASLGASWVILVRLGRILARLGSVLEPKSLQHKPDSTWNGKRRSFLNNLLED